MDHEIRTLRAHFWSDRDPDGRAFAPLAEAYLNRGDVEEALALVQDGLGRLPDYATGHLVAARVHRVRGDHAAARGAVEALLALDRGNAPGLRLLGEIAEEAGEVQAAIDAFREALERDPGYADLEGRIARLGYPAAGDPSRGLAHPDDEPLLRESFRPLHAGMEELDGDLEEFDGDLKEIDTELRTGPGSGSDTEFDLESDTEPEPEFDTEFDPASEPESHPSPSPSEDLIFHPFDEPPEASSEEASSEEAPSEGDSSEDKARGEEASAEEATSGEPAPPLATRTMAELYIRQGFIDRGVEVYRQLVRRDPEDPGLRSRLAELESAARGEAPGEDPAAADAAEGNEEVGPPDGGEEDDPWGSAPQWTGGDPGTAATDRSPFAWVPDAEDTEAEAVSEREAREREADQALRGGRGPSAGQYLQDLLAWEPGAVPIESLAPEADPGEGEGGGPQGESLSDDPGDDGGQGLSRSGSREG
jgi:tetratricopeptide (TPR) repeat protein